MYDFDHAETCPNREAHRRSFATERARAEHAEKLLWEALQPITCPNCGSQDAVFVDNPSHADPCRVVLWACKGCKAQFSDFPMKHESVTA
jgi:transposase-like protein